MRIPSRFGERTQTDKLPKAKYFLIYEGSKTEVDYFAGIKENAEKLGIKPLIEIIPVLRSDYELSWSNPQRILDQLISYIDLANSDELKLELFLNEAVDFTFENRLIPIMQSAEIKKLYFSHFIGKGFNNEDKIKVNKACEILVDFLNNTFGVANVVDKLDEFFTERKINYDANTDKICIIVDRDKQSFKGTQYDEVLKVSSDKRYLLFVSNPCFEFWLLLHFDEVLNISKQDLLENKKINKNVNFITMQLKTILGGFNKNRINFDDFINGIRNAVKNEKLFCENICELKNNLGTNIGILIEQLLN